MDTLDKQIAIEKFVNATMGNVDEINRLVSFLRIDDPKQKAMLDLSMSIITNKLHKVKRCRTVEDTNEYIKTKKVIKHYVEKP